MKLKKALMSGVTVLGMLPGAGLILGGCSSAPRATVVAADFEPAVALAAVGAPMRFDAPSGNHFRLGAGDNLGAAVFSNYVEIVRANGGWQYASGSERVD